MLRTSALTTASTDLFTQIQETNSLDRGKLLVTVDVIADGVTFNVRKQRHTNDKGYVFVVDMEEKASGKVVQATASDRAVSHLKNKEFDSVGLYKKTIIEQGRERQVVRFEATSTTPADIIEEFTI